LTAWDWSATSILLLSYAWDPAENAAETLAARRLAAALLDAGAQIHVLAVNRAAHEFDVARSYHVTLVSTTSTARTRVGRAWQMVRSRIPEVEGNWVDDAVRSGVRVLSSLPRNTIIYGRAMPGAANIAAWRLARLTGAPWVAHFSDAWPSFQLRMNGRGWLAPYKWPLFQLWRNRIIRDAGALTFTNDLQAREFLGSQAEHHWRKCFVVAHLGSQKEPRDSRPQFDRFTIVHTGNFYPPLHTSAPLMRGLQLFLAATPEARGCCRLIQAGWSNGDMEEWSKRCGLDDVVHFVGRLSQQEIVTLLDGASLLIGVDYARPGSTTVLSKLPDYINARRPILAIAAPSSAMARLFEQEGVGLTAHYESPEQVAACIKAVFDAWRERQIDGFLPRASAFEAFSRRRVLAELARAFHLARSQHPVTDSGETDLLSRPATEL
jgi:glycosyltransferase involved in cell wall biosynthesis